MKILLLTTHLQVGGIPVYVVNLAKALKSRGHTPVVASAGGWLEKRFFEAGIPHFKIPCHTSSELNPKLWLFALPKLLRIIFRERPDLIHAHTRVAQVLACILSFLTKIPYVTTCHGLYRYRIGRKLFRCWGKWVMAISQSTLDRLLHDYQLSPPHRVILVWNGVEVDHFLKPVPFPERLAFQQSLGLKGNPIIGGIGRLSPVKGFDTVLKSIPPLLDSFPHLQLLLVGDGPARETLIRLAYQLKIADRVVISHPVEDTRIPLSVMDLFLMPSMKEGFGLAMVEAMAAGVPVVATNSGGPATMLEDGKSGILIPPGDPEVLTHAIRALLSDPDQRARMGKVAQEMARKSFDMKRVAQEVEAVYQKTVDGRFLNALSEPV